MCSFLLLKSLLLAACALGLEAAHENEILNSFREFLNHLPNQDHFYTDGVVLNIGNMDNNKQNIEVHLHASRIDPKTTKLVKCTGTVHRVSDGSLQIHTESGYKCIDDDGPKDTSDKRHVFKRDTEIDEDLYEAFANTAMHEFIIREHIEEGDSLRVTGVYEKEFEPSPYPTYKFVALLSNMEYISPGYTCHCVVTMKDKVHVNVVCHPRYTAYIPTGADVDPEDSTTTKRTEKPLGF